MMLLISAFFTAAICGEGDENRWPGEVPLVFLLCLGVCWMLSWTAGGLD